MSKIDRIRLMEKREILFPENMPTPTYWRWDVKSPELLPSEFQRDYEQYGEIRWYGED